VLVEKRIIFERVYIRGERTNVWVFLVLGGERLERDVWQVRRRDQGWVVSRRDRLRHPFVLRLRARFNVMNIYFFLFSFSSRMKNKRFRAFFLLQIAIYPRYDRSSDTGYSLDQHFIPFGKFSAVDVIVRARRDG